MKKLLIVAALMFTEISAYSQDISASDFMKVILQLSDRYNNIKNYSVNVSYRSYSNNGSGLIADEYSGYIIKRGTQYKSNAAGIFTLRNETIRVTVDSSEKQITITDPEVLYNLELLQLDTTTIRSFANKITETRTGNGVQYRVDFHRGLSMTAYEFSLNNEGLLNQVKIFYDFFREEGFGSDVRNVQYAPCLEIRLHDYNMSPRFTADEFNEEVIVRKIDNGKIYSVKNNGFSLSDQRVNKPQ